MGYPIPARTPYVVSSDVVMTTLSRLLDHRIHSLRWQHLGFQCMLLYTSVVHLPPPHNIPLSVHLESHPVVSSGIRTDPVSTGVARKYVAAIGAGCAATEIVVLRCPCLRAAQSSFRPLSKFTQRRKTYPTSIRFCSRNEARSFHSLCCTTRNHGDQLKRNTLKCMPHYQVPTLIRKLGAFARYGLG